MQNHSVISSQKRITGKVVANDNSWVVHMSVTDENQTYSRIVSVHTCQAVLEVSALLTALAVDPVGVLGSDDPNLQSDIQQLTDMSTSKDESASSPRPDAPTTASKDKSESKQLSPQPPDIAHDERINIEDDDNRWLDEVLFLGGVGLALETGITAPLRPGAAAWADLRFHRVFVETMAYFIPETTLSVSNSSSTDAENIKWSTTSVVISVSAGQQFDTNRITLGWSLGMNGIYIRAASVGVVAPRNTSIWVAATSIGAKLRWRLFKAGGVFFDPGLQVLWSKPNFSIEGIGVIQQSSRVAALGMVGLFLKWGKRK
ncbi:MAG: hypothetical protein JXX29_22815 [Deltaproteobacteria bacterium]|nr:hypothetical protein [Deltaproteobacteria bacterium]MBN2674531.1 hypothetical protein [Deltaproteobacteria bacterium]